MVSKTTVERTIPISIVCREGVETPILASTHKMKTTKKKTLRGTFYEGVIVLSVHRHKILVSGLNVNKTYM